MHAVLQGPGENPIADFETSDDAGQDGPHLPRALHFNAIS